MRRVPPPRDVERLARRCAALFDWLDGPGRSADPAAYAVVVAAFEDLAEAVGWLERGPHYLREHGLIRSAEDKPPEDAPPPSARPAEAFTEVELVMLDTPVLTTAGWLTQAPLLPYLIKVQAELGGDSTTKAALAEILRRWAEATNQSATRVVRARLKALEMRVSREVKEAAAAVGTPGAAVAMAVKRRRKGRGQSPKV